MSYKGTYEGKSLKHYRTKGSLNGYTKYPGKYFPIGDRAKITRQLLGSAANPNSMMSQLERFNISNNRRRGSTGATSAARPNNQSDVYAPNNLRGHFANSNAPLSSAARPNSSASKKYEYEKARQDNQRAAETARIRGNGVSTYEQNRINNQRRAESSRIAGGSGKTSAQRQAEAEAARIAGGSGKTAAQRQQETMDRRIKGGNYGSKARTKAGPTSGYEAQQVTWQAGINRRRSAAEERKIAGSRDIAATKARVHGDLRKSAAASAVRNSRSDIGNAVADAKKDAKRLIKKGKKKVRSLLRKFF